MGMTENLKILEQQIKFSHFSSVVCTCEGSEYLRWLILGHVVLSVSCILATYFSQVTAMTILNFWCLVAYRSTLTMSLKNKERKNKRERKD